MSAWTDKRDTFWATIDGWFKSLEGRIESLLSNGATAIATAVTANAATFEGDIVAFLEQAAKDAVTAAESAPGDGQAKMLVALASFGAALATKGLALAENEARILLENALAGFKASQTAKVA